ncbi:MAG: type II secretion system GspH family protein [Desulfobacteraceae bacterium]|nr:type II secretion system GspH family protein [Desulfobacteraceae bacterium]
MNRHFPTLSSFRVRPPRSRAARRPVAFLSRIPRRKGFSRRGFTLIEMLVGLIIATLVVGGVLGLISSSMRHRFRIEEKRMVQPVLEAAAQTILAAPFRATEGNIQLAEMSGSPVVSVRIAPVPLDEATVGGKSAQLCRVILGYKTGELEFSLLVPNKDTTE